MNTTTTPFHAIRRALAAAAAVLAAGGCAPFGQSSGAIRAKERYSARVAHQLEVAGGEIEKFRDAYFALEVPRAFAAHEAEFIAAEAELRSKGLFTASASAELRQKYAHNDAILRRGIAEEKARWDLLRFKVDDGARAIDTLSESEAFEAAAAAQLSAHNQLKAGDVLGHLSETSAEVAAKRAVIKELERRERALAIAQAEAEFAAEHHAEPAPEEATETP